MNTKEVLQQTINETLGSGVSQNELAKQCNVSAATIINIRKGEWELISDKMIAKLKAHFKLSNWPTRRTINLEKISAACKNAKEEKRMIAIAGYTGSGKTTALRYYARTHSETYYVLATSIMTKKSFLREVQRSMGISEGSGIQDMMSAIIIKMNSGANPLLIIDDTGKLSMVIQRLIQIIYDSTEFSAGIVLSGTESFKVELDKFAQRNKTGFRELKRRIAYWQPLYRPQGDFVEMLCHENGIMDPYAIEYIQENATDYGTLRHLIQNATRYARKKKLQIGRDVLEGLLVGDHHYQSITA